SADGHVVVSRKDTTNLRVPLEQIHGGRIPAFHVPFTVEARYYLNIGRLGDSILKSAATLGRMVTRLAFDNGKLPLLGAILVQKPFGQFVGALALRVSNNTVDWSRKVSNIRVYDYHHDPLVHGLLQ